MNQPAGSTTHYFTGPRQRMAALAATMRGSMSELKFLALAAIVTGMAAGGGAAFLKFLIARISAVVTWAAPVDRYCLLFLIVPVVGIVLCSLFSRHVVKLDMEQGCERIRQNLLARNYYLPSRLTFSPIVACALTIGFGGSAGAEGPIAYAGAAIGSGISRYLRMPPSTTRLLLIIGAGAGIAGIFKAPVGGAMFALEVLAMPLTTAAIVALLFACVTAAATAYTLSGFTLDVAYTAHTPFEPAETWGAILLGIFCGVYSLYYSHMLHRSERWIRSIGNTTARNVVSGLAVGAMILAFPALYGEGYDILNPVINGNPTSVMNYTDMYSMARGGTWTLIFFITGTFLLKGAATGITNSGGGVGGEFTPTLFAGGMGGLLFATTANAIFPGLHINVAHFALFGMAGVMAGAIQAPLMALFLTVEMTGDYGMFFPLMITSFISFATVRLVHRLRPGHQSL